MELTRLHTTAWGRILLLLRADYYEYRRVLWAMLGATAVCVLLLPRVPLLLEGSIYDVWTTGDISNGTASFFRSLGMLAISLYTLYYLNRRTQHATPMGFALYPAQVWEKATAMAIFALSTMTISWAALLLCDIINYLTISAPMHIHWGMGWFTSDATVLKASELRESMIYACSPLITLLLSVATGLVYFIGMASFRGFIKALLISQVALALGTWVMASLGLANLRIWLATFVVDIVRIPRIEPWGLIDIKITLVTLITLSAIIALEVWYLLRKLSTIQS